MEGEVSILLVVTVVVGTLLMGSLLVCYICVFRQLCCSTETDGHQGSIKRHRVTGKPTYATCQQHHDSLNLNELTITHESCPPTETERI